MQKEVVKEQPTCPKCGRKSFYFRKDGTIFCKACGYDSRKGK